MKQKPIEISGLWFRTSGTRAEVLIEHNGKWKTVVPMHFCDGSESHIMEPSFLEKAPVTEWVYTPKDLKWPTK